MTPILIADNTSICWNKLFNSWLYLDCFINKDRMFGRNIFASIFPVQKGYLWGLVQKIMICNFMYQVPNLFIPFIAWTFLLKVFLAKG